MSEEITQSPNFDSIRQVNPYGAEFWSARDLMPLLGYRNWREFNNVVNKAKIACEQSDQIVEHHFGDAPKMIETGKGAKRSIKDYSLSRFACYLIAQNGDPRKPQIAAAQAYFAIATREFELQELADKQRRRVELREGIIERNQTLNQAASQVGVQNKNFGTFHNAGYKGLYGGLGVKQIKERKGIAANEDLLDWAGLGELGANALRIDLTEQKLRSDEVSGEAQAIQTHNEVGKGIRETIQRFGGAMPESLPAEPSVKPLVLSRKRNKEKAIQPQEQTKMFDE